MNMKDETINLQYTTIKDPLPEFIYEDLGNYSAGANIYHPQPQELIEKLAKKHNLPVGMIYLTAGIDEAIQIFAKTYGSNTFAFTPSYAVYADVKEFGGKLTKIPSVEASEYKINTKEIDEASLIYLANPNNPSGFTPKVKVIELVENNKKAIVCVDEAYGEFAPELSVIDQVKKYKHLAVFRSFSKDYGMAGNRIGYFIAHPEVLNVVKNKTQWANVSYLSVGAATIALDHESYFLKMREDIHKRRKDFMDFLDKRGLRYFPSRINAVLLKFKSKEKGTEFANFLKSNNFVISHSNGNSNIGLDESHVRISIGNEKQMKTLKETIKEYR